ncbi:hypothetical protein F0919_12980 [Taibaiella lutea]|uniref:Uncharacterized protein n=1 Tax=Taibaiella lutea TaxID=2608001 RepID=A0A5M6CE44_9BACT|nr:hypothetical protein [Taibaiella lutea]KAA5533448.1 hypothetical protein F0919_12980 [Taibaiella lutea]
MANYYASVANEFPCVSNEVRFKANSNASATNEFPFVANAITFLRWVAPIAIVFHPFRVFYFGEWG